MNSGAHCRGAIAGWATSMLGMPRKIRVVEHDASNYGGRLIAKARNDPAAFAELYRRHYGCILQYCVHRLFTRAAAEDATATVFLRAVRRFDQFRGDEKGFRCWLYTIATNTINEYLRTARRRERIGREVSEACFRRNPTGSEPAEERVELMATVREAMLGLKPAQQAIIALRFFENLKLADIATIIGTTPGTVRKDLSRGLTRLRRVLTAASPGHAKEAR